MSILFVNADPGEIIDIVENRRLSYLRQYFLGFTKETRLSVKNIVIDMYSPYRTLIKALFTNAKIIIVKCHVVQLFNRSLNKSRIKVMPNSYHTNCVIEGINNKVNVQKRIAFGYKSFLHFRNRILIMQGMLIIKKRGNDFTHFHAFNYII